MSEQIRFRNAQTGETFTVTADGERRWIPSGAYELEVSPAAREGLAALVERVSVVPREQGGVQIEGHTLSQDWELEIDAQGHVVGGDIPQLREGLAALVAEWRETAAYEADNANPQYAQGMDACADALAAWLKAQGEQK